MYVCLSETTTNKRNSQENLLNNLFSNLNISAKKFLKKKLFRK